MTERLSLSGWNAVRFDASVWVLNYFKWRREKSAGPPFFLGPVAQPALGAGTSKGHFPK